MGKRWLGNPSIRSCPESKPTLSGLSRAKFAGCFTDHRNPNSIEHSARTLVVQRVYALALRISTNLDHLRADCLLALLGKKDAIGEERASVNDQGNPLTASSTLNRLT